MKYIITEAQFNRLILEDRSYSIMSAIEKLNKMINNFEHLDCKDENLIYDNEYVKIYCSQLHGATLEELKDIKNQMEDELTSLVSREFQNKIRM